MGSSPAGILVGSTALLSASCAVLSRSASSGRGRTCVGGLLERTLLASRGRLHLAGQAIIQAIEERQIMGRINRVGVTKTKLTHVIDTHTSDATIGANNDEMTSRDGHMLGHQALRDRGDENGTITRCPSSPLTRSIDTVIFSDIESNFGTGKDASDLTVEDAVIHILEGAGGVIVSQTQVTIAVGTKSGNLIAAVATTQEEAESTVSNGDIINSVLRTEDSGDIGSDSLAHILVVRDDKLDTISSNQVGIDQLGSHRHAVLRRGEVALERKRVLHVGEDDRINHITTGKHELAVFRASENGELDVALVGFLGELDTTGVVNIHKHLDLRARLTEVEADEILQAIIMGIDAISVHGDVNHRVEINIHIHDMASAHTGSLAHRLAVEEENGTNSIHSRSGVAGLAVTGDIQVDITITRTFSTSGTATVGLRTRVKTIHESTEIQILASILTVQLDTNIELRIVSGLLLLNNSGTVTTTTDSTFATSTTQLVSREDELGFVISEELLETAILLVSGNGSSNLVEITKNKDLVAVINQDSEVTASMDCRPTRLRKRVALGLFISNTVIKRHREDKINISAETATETSELTLTEKGKSRSTSRRSFQDNSSAVTVESSSREIHTARKLDVNIGTSTTATFDVGRTSDGGERILVTGRLLVAASGIGLEDHDLLGGSGVELLDMAAMFILRGESSKEATALDVHARDAVSDITHNRLVRSDTHVAVVADVTEDRDTETAITTRTGDAGTVKVVITEKHITLAITNGIDVGALARGREVDILHLGEDTSEGFTALVIVGVAIGDQDLDSGVIVALTLGNQLVLLVISHTISLALLSHDDNMVLTGSDVHSLLTTLTIR